MGETLMELIVGAVSLPVILRVQKAKTGVALQCESAGWYPEPELLWLDGEGNLLSAGPTETLRGPDDLYTVSSRVTVEKRHSNNITCRVQQRNTNQSRETHIYISDYFFTAPPNPSVCVSLLTLFVISLFCILLVIFVGWIQRRKKIRIQTNHAVAQMEQD
ncbi:putative butyrophilin subfamily 2 member A3 [Simochromis diagramma]|uniref:putative butyrophilin subfamily 2 member A3 n=1 Tax=Simochromis diagramma TaxID=43689 RepID=UPI001A7F0A46|nr:putative butyrophilin subfamily 2 member A3 [Simochromis diagramma]